MTGTNTPLKQKIEVRVNRVSREADGISSFVFVDPSGAELPAFTAGAHIEVHITPDMIRSYSISSAPTDRSRYEIAVLKEAAGRGGSVAMHERIKEGDILTITTPINHFPLAGKEARAHLLLAGGIGVTPMMAMIAELEAKNAKWQMHYLTREPSRTAFSERLKPYVEAGKVKIHHDFGDPTKGPGISKLLQDFEIGTHLYFCGPPGFMTACAGSVEAWPPHAVHREYFAAAEKTGDEAPNEPFDIKVKSTGQVLNVPADKTIVEVLADVGVFVETDCKDGYCGTCITRYLSGTPDHRDTVLSEKERKSYIMVCCGRAKSAILELDL